MSRRNKERAIPSYEDKVRAIYDFWTFIDLISFRGGTKNFGACHKEVAAWTYRLDGEYRKLHLLPRGHLKSTLLSVAKTLHRTYQNPNIRRFVGCAGRELSTAFVRELRAYYEDPWLQEHVWNSRPHIDGRLVPIMDSLGRSRRDDTEAEDKKVVWRNDALQLIRSDIMKEPTIVSGSVGSTATGFHYDELVFDDIVTFDNSNTTEKLNHTMSWVNDLESVLDPPWFDDELFNQLTKVGVPEDHSEYISTVGGVIDVLGTRYEKEDYYGHILAAAKELEFETYERNIYVNYSDVSDGYLWPERFTEKDEKKLRANMIPRRFASQYLNSILAPEDIIFDFNRINWLHPAQVTKKPGGLVEIRLANKPDPIIIRPVLCLDPAATANKKSDYTAMGVGGKDVHKNLYMLDIKFGKWLPDQWVKSMYELIDKWGLKGVTIETNFQENLVMMLRKYFLDYKPIVIRHYKQPTNIQKKDKLETVLQPLFENSMLWLPTYAASNSELKDMINFFPRETVKDDPLDVMEMIYQVSNPLVVVKDADKRNRDLVNRKYGGYR